jgi:hypothetical protein
LLGISGHPLTVIPLGEQVEAHDERGSYTVVTWTDRRGFVLTECLALPAGESPEPAFSDSTGLSDSPATRRWNWLLPVALAISLIAIYALVH